MGNPAKPKIRVPNGLDHEAVIAQYNDVIGQRTKRFKDEVANLKDFQKLQVEMGMEAKRAGLLPAADQKISAFSERAIKLLRGYHPIYAETPLFPQGGGGAGGNSALVSPPYAGVYSSVDVPDGVPYAAWHNSPNVERGELGGTIDMYQHGGVAVVDGGFVVPLYAAAGTNRVEVVGSLQGIYYLQSPGYEIAGFEVDLVSTFINGSTTPPTYQYGSQALAIASTDFFAAGQVFGTIYGTNLAPGGFQPGDTLSQFTRVFTFPPLANPALVQAVIGINERLVCTPGASGLIQANVIINSIAIY